MGISSLALKYRTILLNIENLKCTMLIGAVGIDSQVLEIATGPKALAMTAGDGATFPPGEGMRLWRKINLEVFAKWQNTIVTTSRRISSSRIR